MSYILIQRLTKIRDEFEAARAAIDYLVEHWNRIDRELGSGNLEFFKVRRASANLEATYVIRLFSAFEGALREILPSRSLLVSDRRGAYELINRAASRWRVSATVKDNAHLVREFRNAEVHQSIVTEQDMTFMEALAGLNRFLSWAP